jgi:hypothetical protein
MSLTLEVSKLSGWLKAFASCRVQRGHPTEGRTRCTEMWHTEERANQQHVAHACVCGPAWECGQKAQAEAHIEHGAHVCNAGGVKAQRLVESKRTLPSPKGASEHTKGSAWQGRNGTERRVNQERARRACGPQLRSVGRRRRRKRTKNMKPMSVTLEVSKLSGWLKAAAPCRVQSDGHPTKGHAWHGDVAHRGKGGPAACSARVRVWPSSGVWAGGAGGSAHRTWSSCL